MSTTQHCPEVRKSTEYALKNLCTSSLQDANSRNIQQRFTTYYSLKIYIKTTGENVYKTPFKCINKKFTPAITPAFLLKKITLSLKDFHIKETQIIPQKSRMRGLAKNRCSPLQEPRLPPRMNVVSNYRRLADPFLQVAFHNACNLQATQSVENTSPYPHQLFRRAPELHRQYALRSQPYFPRIL